MLCSFVYVCIFILPDRSSHLLHLIFIVFPAALAKKATHRSSHKAQKATHLPKQHVFGICCEHLGQEKCELTNHHPNLTWFVVEYYNTRLVHWENWHAPDESNN